MARWLLTFGVLHGSQHHAVAVAAAAGPARLPGDLAVDFVPGVSFYLPITTSC